MKLTNADIHPSRLTFNSHKKHNPQFDILELSISPDAFITYSLELNTGNEYLEYYAGENYVGSSTAKSTSRKYDKAAIPKKYNNVWNGLKEYYRKNYQA